LAHGGPFLISGVLLGRTGGPAPKPGWWAMTTTVAATVLDFDPREADVEAAARTRRLLGRVLASQGPAGLARALHVSAPRATQLKHRVACVTCRSRLDGLAAGLAAAASTTVSDSTATEQPPAPPDGPAPLTAWLAADAGRGLAPAPRALRDLSALAAFLAAFGAASPGAAGSEDILDDTNRRGGRSSGVVRCPHHAPRAVARAAAAAVVAAAAGGPMVFPAAPTGCACSGMAVQRERERYIAILRGGTSDAEWRTLGTIDIDNAMCDLFAWLGDRGLCSGCVDAVTGALLEVRRAVSVAGTCTCSRCMGRCSDKASSSSPTQASASAPIVAGGPPELVRVQGRLRAICGVYRLEPLPFNDRPVYKKERAEAYLLYTSLKDWMVSGRADAGGTRCEGWAYVTDPAETPDEICGVWKVSGPRGWEEDRSLCVTAFEELPEELRAGLGYDDGSAIARHLAANERGVLAVPLQEPEVLEEVLWAPDEPPPGRSRTGACAHVLTAEAAQRELRCWLRWLLRDRLDAQRRRVLAQAQVGASLCRLFACAALQQLEQAADVPSIGVRGRDKKGRAKKVRAVLRDGECTEDAASTAEVDGLELGEGVNLADGTDLPDGTELVDVNRDPADTSGSISSRLCASTSAGCTTAADSDESVSTRASSEEPPDAHRARLAIGARRLMEQMGWRPEAVGEAALDGAEVAAWRDAHPRYRQAVREERQKLKTQFQIWARATV